MRWVGTTLPVPAGVQHVLQVLSMCTVCVALSLVCNWHWLQAGGEAWQGSAGWANAQRLVRVALFPLIFFRVLLMEDLHCMSRAMGVR